MGDAHLLRATPGAAWLPRGSTAEAWVGSDCGVPDPCIIVRLLLVRSGVRSGDGGAEFFSVPTHRGPDLPSLAVTAGPVDALADLARATYGSGDGSHVCVGWIRNVVPHPDPSYPHPSPWAHVPVFRPVGPVRPVHEGTWATLGSAADQQRERHWWPIVEHHLRTRR